MPQILKMILFGHHLSVKEKQLFIFDFDDTIVKLDVDWNKLKRLLIERSKKSIGYLWNVRWRMDENLYYIRDHLDKEFYNGLISEISEYEYHGFDHEKIEKHILGFAKTKHNIAVLSSNTRRAIQKILKHPEFNNFNPYVIGKEDMVKPKPDTKSIQIILEHFRIKKEDAIYIGDSSYDEEMARRTGVHFINTASILKSNM